MERFRIGNGYDVHALAAGLPLVLGGVRIVSPVGCVAHSDGDVAIHALCDALLGALALGDIGKHFPDSSEEFRGIDSRILLERTMAMIRERCRQRGHYNRTAEAETCPLHHGNERGSRIADGHGYIMRLSKSHNNGTSRLRRTRRRMRGLRDCTAVLMTASRYSDFQVDFLPDTDNRPAE